EFHGYFRAGFSSNTKGGDADAFQAPGAYSKFRLGNEVETYGEIELDNNWVNPDHNDTWFKTVTMLAVVAPRNNSFDTPTGFAVREAFGQAGHFVPSQPELSVWAGERYYRRRDSHIIDFFYQDTSGYGAGFEDLKLGGKLKLAVAYLGGSRELNDGEVTNIGRPVKNMFDIRLYDVPAGKGSLEFWLIPSFAVSGDEDPGATGNHSGIGGGVFYFLPFLGGFNEASVQYGYAGSANFSPSFESIAHDGWLFRFVDRATIQATPNLSLTWSAVFQLDNKDGDDFRDPDTGKANSSLGNLWISAGARPVYNFTKYTGIAFDAGLDVVKPQTPGSKYGELGTFSIAPLIRPGMDFWARPEIRVFLTFAKWSDSIKGAVGGDAFKNQTYGLTSGVQFESWW
ncbi:MAG TPA: carbohydrate porin, partial [Kofleriaceae bacterium]|nr:carbohydrate porin [Kofleriaceae bacterium]